MENFSRGPTFGGFVTIRIEGSMQGTSQLQDYRVQEFRLSSPPSFKCNVLRQSLAVDQSKYSLRNTKEKEVVGNLYVSLVRMIHIWG
jgi:hypothetical protein